MSRMLPPLAIAASLFGAAAPADAPRVAADIAPVHSLAARVMQGVAAPELIMPPGASPHDYNLRPSNAAALQAADLVFWVGPALTPWLDRALDTLAPQAKAVELLEAPGTTVLASRDNALFAADAHDEHDERHGDGDHGHGHEDHGHDAHHEDDDHGHDHGPLDTHAWLSPANAAAWLGAMAEELAAADPANAEIYRANAEAGRAELAALTAEVAALLADVPAGRFVVFHDAYQYFETAFARPSAGAISIGDAADPSPARLARIRELIRDRGVDCVLAEPQFNDGVVSAVAEGAGVRTAVLDPLGAGLTPGPDLYPSLMRNLATALASCH